MTYLLRSACVAMLVFLMSAESWAAPPRRGRGRPAPARRPSANRPANRPPRAAPARNPHAATRPHPSAHGRPPRPAARNAHPAPHANRHPGRRPVDASRRFTPGWYANHPRSWWATHHVRPRPAVTWVGLASWVGLRSGPVIHEYGYDGTEEVIVRGDEIPDGENPFIEQAEDEQAERTDGQWFPLGMYGLIPPGLDEEIAVVQLAVSRDGQIGGTYQDVMTDGVYDLHGSLDRKTQKVSWRLDSNESIVYETGLHNLTEPKTSLAVRLGDRDKQTWTLRRMNVESP